MEKNETSEKKGIESKMSLEDLYSNKSSNLQNNINEENSNEENINFNENEKEFEMNDNLLNISINSPKEEIIEFETESIETISIKKFRSLLGVLGIKATNFIIERLYQTLIRISSKKYEHISSNLTDKNFQNYISILNNSAIHNEIFYTFFDISNKGFITKNDFISVAENMIKTICEFSHKNANSYKENVVNFFENKILGKNNQRQSINKDEFMNMIENNEIDFYEIMNFHKYKYVEKDKKNEINKDLLYSIKFLKNIIKQKEDIETNLTIVTDNFLDNADITKEEKLQSENSINLSNVSSFIDNNSKSNNNNKYDNLLNSNTSSNPKLEKNNESYSLNTNKTSFLICPKITNDTKIKSPQERLNNKPNFSDDEIDEISSDSHSIYSKEEADINYDFVKEINDINIKDIKNIKKNKIKTNKNINLNELQKKKFFFLKPFKPKENKALEDELKKNNIDINDSLILLKKNNFLNYLENLENQIKENNTESKINNEKEISNIGKDMLSNNIILNKPLKEKENFEKQKNYFNDLNNQNMELLLVITLGIQKCISSLDNYDLLDKNIINDLIGQEIKVKTSRKNRNSLFPTKIEKKSNINNNSNALELISNYPFKKNKYIFEQKNSFNYTFYKIEKKEENLVTLNKAEIVEYAPEIFCNIRYTLGEITNKNFLKSFNIENLISNIFFGKINNLSELLTINNNNFPEFIMFSPDTKYIVKCINSNEFEVFQKMLPNYYDYLMNIMYKTIKKNNTENINSVLSSTLCSSNFNQLNNLNIESKNTFLEIIYGLYSISFLDKIKYFVIKKNIFFSLNNLSISKRYDLKGCSVDRKSKSKNSYVHKDLDFLENSEKINLSSKISNYICDILEKDTSFLSQNNIINYSFYLGIAELPENFEHENDEGIISTDKNLMYYFGINDIFTEYGKGKIVEHIFKKITKGDSISAVPPDDYKKRFDNFIKICLK